VWTRCGPTSLLRAKSPRLPCRESSRPIWSTRLHRLLAQAPGPGGLDRVIGFELQLGPFAVAQLPFEPPEGKVTLCPDCVRTGRLGEPEK
jgi:hypothetical protein